MKMILPFPPGRPMDAMARLDRGRCRQTAWASRSLSKTDPAPVHIGFKAVATADQTATRFCSALRDRLGSHPRST